MNGFRTFINNPFSGLLVGMTVGALAGYQYGLVEVEGRK